MGNKQMCLKNMSFKIKFGKGNPYFLTQVSFIIVQLLPNKKKITASIFEAKGETEEKIKQTVQQNSKVSDSVVAKNLM